jgi:NADPH:quinone reductase-like Zn-dependent oxidoreductase
MKAAAYTRYGPPDVVQIMDVEKPVPKDNEVLINLIFSRRSEWTTS